jgi:poly(hydroxyalkanoate) granule-associated protein
MASKKGSRGAGAASESELGRAMADSAQKIWLAGLGAFERAKAEGPKMFEALVEQGNGLRERAREAADQALKAVREGASGAGGRFDKLEQVFEERVSKSLGRLGVLTRAEVADLGRQVSELTEEVRKLTASAPRAGAKKGKAGKKRAATRGSRARRA